MIDSDLILVDEVPSYRRVALICDGVLDQIWIDDAEKGEYLPEAIVAVKLNQHFRQHHRAVISLGEVKGSLRLPDQHPFKVGDVIPAVITSAARDDGFGAKPLQLKLAGHIKPAECGGHGDVITPAPSALEKAQAHAPHAKIIEDADLSYWHEFGVEEALEEALAPQLDLKEGGRIAISTPPGAAVIDGDSGPSQLAPFALAQHMITPVMRQLRLRRIGGPIVIDFPRLNPAEAKIIHQSMQAEAKKDNAKPALHGFTRGGLYTMARPWRGQMLADEKLDPSRALGLEVLRQIRRHLHLVKNAKAAGGLTLRLNSIGLDWIKGEGALLFDEMMKPASFQVDFVVDDDILNVIEES